MRVTHGLFLVCLAAALVGFVTDTSASDLDIALSRGFASNSDNEAGSVTGLLTFGLRQRPLPIGVTAAFDRFDQDGGGSVSFTSLAIEARLPRLNVGRFGLFGFAAPGFYLEGQSFSQRAQAMNDLLPESDHSLSFGMAFGGRAAVGLFDALEVFSTLRWHSVRRDVQNAEFWVASIGLGVDLP